jgi:hypothetical protein
VTPNSLNLTFEDVLPANQPTENMPQITVSVFEFFGVPVSGRSLNGVWIDFTVVMLMWIYLNNYSFWILKKDFKIEKSHRTIELLEELWQIDKTGAESFDEK